MLPSLIDLTLEFAWQRLPEMPSTTLRFSATSRTARRLPWIGSCHRTITLHIVAGCVPLLRSANIFRASKKATTRSKWMCEKVAVLDDNVAYVAGFDEFAAIRNGQTGTSSNGFNGFGRSEAIMADYSSALVAALMNTRWQ